jgi:hypothetical protein
MSQLRQGVDANVLVRFWSLDHHRAEPIFWPPTNWTKLVYGAEGTMVVEAGGELHLVPPCRAILLAPNQAHSARTTGRAKIRTLYFPGAEGVVSRALEVRPLLRELITEACRIGPLFEDRPLHREMTALLRWEIVHAPSNPTRIPMPTTPWLKAWADSFLADPRDAPPPPCSHRTHERIIQRETGLTLGQWRQRARALVGLRALSEGQSVAEAAFFAGFETSSGFIPAFRRQFGVTPGRILHPDRVR